MLSLLLAITLKQSTLTIDHVNVIDCASSGIRMDVSVSIQDGRIRSISKTSTGGSNHVDGKGKYLIPGLWDMHVHGTGIPGFLGVYLANGITGVRDMFDPYGLTVKLKTEIASGKTLGPHIVAAGRIVDGPKPIWPGSIAVSNADEGRKAVGAVLAQGSDFVKVYSLLPRDAYFAIADEAKKRHVVFAGHVPDLVTSAEASDAGQKSFEHLFGIMQGCSKDPNVPARFSGLAPGDIAKKADDLIAGYDETRANALFEKLKKNGTWQCPTFTVLYSISHPKDLRPEIQYRYDYLPAFVRSTNATFATRAKDWTKEDEAAMDRYFKKELEVVGTMNRAGVRIIAGTDVMNPYCLPGFSLHDELQWLVKAGLKPIEALRAATLNPAIYLGQEKDYGTVQAGKIADLVLLNANPLADIHNTTQISAVIIGGKLLDKSELNKLMPKLAKSATTSDRVWLGGYDGD